MNHLWLSMVAGDALEHSHVCVCLCVCMCTGAEGLHQHLKSNPLFEGLTVDTVKFKIMEYWRKRAPVFWG